MLFQAEDGIRVLVRSRGLGDVYKRQVRPVPSGPGPGGVGWWSSCRVQIPQQPLVARLIACLLYTSDAADERSSVDLGGRRIIKKTTRKESVQGRVRR